MRVFAAGATGVLGRALIPLLLEAGHGVGVLARSAEKAQPLAASGVAVQLGDLLEPETADRLTQTLAGYDAVLHLATAIPSNPAASGAWDRNTRLRIEGTRHLLRASLAAGVQKYVQQSIVMAYRDGGEEWLDETTPFDDSEARAIICAPVREMENQVRAVAPKNLGCVILRGGSFVGPGTFQDLLVERLRSGREAISGDGSNFVSPVHAADMAAAVVAALKSAPAGSIYNIVDEPVRQRDYLNGLAQSIGAPPPRVDTGRPRPPSFRCSNQKARAELSWIPRRNIWLK